MITNNKVLLIILDGWGLSPIEEGNAILQAKTPVFDSLVANFPHTALSASGNEVGLENGEMGNSEVGHLNLGTGRITQQNLPRINKTISDGSFFNNEELLQAYNWTKKNNSKLHLIGLVSNGGIHSHIDHLFGLLDLAKKQNIKDVVIHMITDGRDCPAKSAESFLGKLNAVIAKTGVGKIAAVSGRYYAMDRDKNWDREEKAYNAMVLGEGEKADSPEDSIKQAYDRGEADENISPTVIDKNLTINDNDSVVFFNYRQDRAKQLASALFDPEFKGFKRKKIIKNMFFVSFTNFGKEPTPLVKIAFFADKIENQLAKIISAQNLTQLHIAETEKYAHVTHFFNGGVEQEFTGEKRILIPSPKVETYDKKPEMSALEVTSQLINFHKKNNPHFTVLNFANPDMVGHTGNLPATIKACEIVDSCLGIIAKKLIEANEANKLIIVGDHGNAEQMINPETKEPDKEHTTNPVPFILVTNNQQLSTNNKLMSIEEKMTFAATQPTGVLADVSPTIINLLGLQKPQEMNGQSLRNII